MKLIRISALTTLLCCASAYANEWQPVAAESLVQLPANLIEKRIEQDFRLSPVAEKINEVENQLSVTGQKIKSIQALLADAQEGEMIDEKVDLIKLKSDFLDNMQEGQNLRQESLSKKVELYQQVLEKFYAQNKAQTETVTYQVKKQQEQARERMQNVMAQVDASFTQNGFAERTPYADEFAQNLAKIEQLKTAIQSHKANIAPTVDGVAVSSQEYVRQLLMQAASEQSLLDQEGLMLSYMSRLVALDAQALEYAINLDDSESGDTASNAATSPKTSIELFL